MKIERCNGERLWITLMEIGEIGHVYFPGSKVGGCHRLELSEKAKLARDMYIKWAKDIGCTLRIDSIGNIFLRKKGKNPELAPVITGSHLDTQPTGGKFDGIYGCIAGLEALRCLAEQKIETLRSIEIAVWTNEEGARFKPAMLGSGVYAGIFKLQDTLNIQDKDGISIKQDLDPWLESKKQNNELNDEDLGCHQYYELHIEQGPVLEAENLDLGVVTGVLGMRWFNIEVKGRSCHAGPSPMGLRNDALVGAALMVTELTKIAESSGINSRCTMGEFNVVNASINVSPGQVHFSIDLRESELDLLNELQTTSFEALHQIAYKHNLELKIKEEWFLPPTAFDESCISNIQRVCEEAFPESKPKRMVSGAGHDAVYVNGVAPTAMIFVPSENGLSHNECEYTTPEQLTKGCDVLLNTLIKAANSK